MKKTPTIVLLAIASIAVLLAVFLTPILRKPRRSSDVDTYCCQSCGAKRLAGVQRRYGVLVKRTDRVIQTLLSRRIAEVTDTDCQHSWRYVWGLHYSGPRSHAHLGHRFLKPALDSVVERPENTEALIRFAEARGRSPTEIWQVLFQYMTWESAGIDLFDGISDSDSRDNKPLDVWLDENYERIVAELKGASPQPAEKDGGDSAEDDFSQF